MDQHDEWLQQTADQALREIARFHEYALQAVWGQYPAPQPPTATRTRRPGRPSPTQIRRAREHGRESRAG